jgi:hypothetical protein
MLITEILFGFQLGLSLSEIPLVKKVTVVFRDKKAVQKA